MTPEEFESKLREMFMPKDGDREYERKETQAANLIRAAILDTTQYCGGTWNNEIAKDRFKQWEWFRDQLESSQSS
jgi:hypothetical protein